MTGKMTKSIGPNSPAIRDMRLVTADYSTLGNGSFDPLQTPRLFRQAASMDEQSGYTPEELERGEDKAWHIPIWGCLAVLVGLVMIGWLTVR